MNTMNNNNTETSTTETVVAHVMSYEACLPRLAKLQRRAARLGCPVPTLTLVARDEVVTHYNAAGIREKYHCDRVALTFGDIVVAGGWRLLAQIDHDLGEGNAVCRAVRGVEVPGSWAEASAFGCDHCGKAMRRRNTYVIHSAREGMRRVGGDCLRDFVGHDATSALAYLKLRLDAEDLLADEGMGGGALSADRRLYELEEVLSHASCAMRATGGYISRAKADELGCKSTATMIRDSYAAEARLLKPEQSDLDLAATVAEWMLALNERVEPSNYIESLATYGRAGVVNWRGIGFVASAISAYQREQSEAALRKGRTSIHVGAVGESLDFLGKVLSSTYLEGQYGISTLYTFLVLPHEDCTVPAGAVIKYISSRNLRTVGDEEEIQRGDEVWIYGTVKKHDEYKGTKQTVITRGSVVSSPSVRAARIALARAEKEAAKEAAKAAKAAVKAAAKEAAKAAKAAAKEAAKASATL